MQRVQLIVNAPTPYRIPLFNELHEQLAAVGCQLQVVFACAAYSRRHWKIDLQDCRFSYVVLKSRSIAINGDAEHTLFFYSGLFKVLRSFGPQVIIVAGFSLATLQVWLYTRLTRVPYIIWSGSIGLEATGPLAVLRVLERRILAGSASAGIAYGTRAKQYLCSLGMPPECIAIAINTVDVAFFRDAVAAARLGAHRAGPQVLTYIGYMSRRKNVRKVLEVIETVARRRGDFVVDIIGDGEERPVLEAIVRKRGIERHARFHGYRQRAELPSFLAASRCVIFQTDRDVWGLILVEAMAAGIPALASINAAATDDLIRDGENGFRVDFDDVTAAADKMTWLLDHPDEAAAMGQAARRFVEEYASLERSAMGAVRAVQSVLHCVEQPERLPRRDGVHTEQ